MESPLSSSAIKTELSTQRLWLRSYTQEVAFEFWQLLHQNRTRLLPDFPDRTNAVQTLEDAQKRLKVFASQQRIGDLYTFGIWRKEFNDYVGDVTLRRLARGKPYAEVGYYLDSNAEGKGYASEALKAIARFAFDTLRMEYINLRCTEANTRSQRVAERSGFSYLKTDIKNLERNPSVPPQPIQLYRLRKDDPSAALLWA